MDVRCPQCDTLYEIDERQLRGGAATFKCSQCEHVFRLQTHAALVRENQRRWMIQNTSSGDVLYCSAFDELHQWILEGKVAKSDQISRTGKKWKKLGDIGEFMPIFQAVESISSISSSRAAQKRAEGSAPHASPRPEASNPAAASEPPRESTSEPKFRSKVQTSQQFVVGEGPDTGSHAGLSKRSRPESNHTPVKAQRSQTPAPRRASGPKSDQRTDPPSNSPTGERSKPKVRLQSGAFGGAPEKDDDWSFGDGSTLGQVEGTGRMQAVEYKGSKSRWPIVLVVAILVGGAGAGVWLLSPDLLDQWLAGSEDEAVVDIAKEKDEQGEDGAGEKDAPPEELVSAATDSALEAVRRSHAEMLGEAVAAASPKLGIAVEGADEKAQKAAEEPNAKELLASANRYLERGHPRHARRKFHEVLEVERRNVEAITGLGWSLLALGSPSSASSQFKKALAIDSGYGDAYIGLGKAEREQGNNAAALRAYRDYLDRFPGGRKASIAEYQAKQLEKSFE